MRWQPRSRSCTSPSRRGAVDAVGNYAEATQRLTGPADRLAHVGDLTIHPVTEDRLDDWAAFFDHEAFVGRPEWAACYCLEPHVAAADAPADADVPHWRQNRGSMLRRLRDGSSFGYLAYVEGRPAGWVEAYPFTEDQEDDGGNFRGPRSMYDERGFEPVRTRARDTVVRRAV